MTVSRLVIGIGNPDRGDDAVGIAVARGLSQRALPGLRIAETGGDMLGLLDLWAGAGRVVLVDAAGPAGRPGRIHRLDPTAGALPRDLSLGSTHGFGLAETLELARTLGRLPPRITILAIEAAGFAHGAALSAPVAAAVDEAIALITADLREVSDA